MQGAATGVAQALRRLQEVECDVVVLDLALAGEDGLVVAREALAADPTSGSSSPRVRRRATRSSRPSSWVRGWVAKTETADALVDAIRGVARGETRIPADLLAGVLVSLSRGQHTTVEHVEGIRELTGRELEVLGCLVEGMNRAEIGTLLHVSPNTVRTHVQSILHKLKVHSALAAVAIARRAGVSGASLPIV